MYSVKPKNDIIVIIIIVEYIREFRFLDISGTPAVVQMILLRMILNASAHRSNVRMDGYPHLIKPSAKIMYAATGTEAAKNINCFKAALNDVTKMCSLCGVSDMEMSSPRNLISLPPVNMEKINMNRRMYAKIFPPLKSVSEASARSYVVSVEPLQRSSIPGIFNYPFSHCIPWMKAGR